MAKSGVLALKRPAALQSPLMTLKGRLKQAAARFLNQEVATYELKAPNSMTQVYRHIRKGDVVLVEGKLRISQFVKYATQSPWSHSALYIGDELLRRGGCLGEQDQTNFGQGADHLIVEALTDQGVVASPLAKYQDHNLRICRPEGIAPADLERVIDFALADLGKQYDSRNFFDLALMLLSPVKFGPLKTRTLTTCLGNCTDLQVICSGMIAKAFERVGYSVLPSIDGGDPRGQTFHGAPRHYSQILPRDFDLSPNFRIIKLGIANFDDHRAEQVREDCLNLETGSPLPMGRVMRGGFARPDGP